MEGKTMTERQAERLFQQPRQEIMNPEIRVVVE